MLPPEITNILSKFTNQVVFELGACDTYHTRLLSMLCSGNYRYFFFEPDPRNARFCRATASANPKLTFIQAAAGNITGRVPFYLSHPDPTGGIGSSSISPFKDQSKAFHWCTMVGCIQVDSWRLDDFCIVNNIDHIDFLWMDVQGAERLVFDGAKTTLTRTRHIMTEFEGLDKTCEGTCYDHSSSLERIMEQLPAWKVEKVFGGDALLTNTAYAPI